MFTSSRLIKVSVIVSALFVVAQASAAWVAQGTKSASFKAVGPGGLSIVGNSSDVRINDTGDTVAITVGLSSLNTGIDMRDRHMKEKYLETPKYPTAVLRVAKSQVKLSVGGADVDGKLTLHGVTKPVKVHYVASGSEKSANITGTLRINMKEFGVEVPSYLGVTVKPDVVVTVAFGATDK